MSHNLSKTHTVSKKIIVLVMAVSLTGCAQIGKISGDMWGYTKSAANFAVSPVTKLLRSTPEQDYVFESSSRSQQFAKAALAADGRRAFDTAQAPLAVPKAPHYEAPFYAPQNYQPVYGNSLTQAQRVVEARPQAPTIAPKTSKDISFVKMGGGSNMQDWVSCEAEAGGFIRVVQGGYLIEPEFENCMRLKGYKPESEVADVIDYDRTL